MNTEAAIPESPMSETTTMSGMSMPEKTIVPDHSKDVATSHSLSTLLEEFPLPRQQGPQWYNRFRYGFFSLYRRLFCLVVLANIATIAVMMVRISRHDNLWKTKPFTYSDATTAVGANLTAAVVLRKEHVINFISRAAVSLPHFFPLAIRKHVAKVCSYGGVHSGCAVSSLLWYIFFTVLLVRDLKGDEIVVDALFVTTVLIITLLVVLISTAHPRIRARYHDPWENCHRYAGWTTVAVVWVQVFLLASITAKQQDPDKRFSHYGTVLIKTPLFWFMITITCCVIYPWLHLRKRSFEVEQLSNHALRLNFDYRQVRVGGAVRLSDAPLLHNHAFAVIPNPDGSRGYMSNNLQCRRLDRQGHQ